MLKNIIPTEITAEHADKTQIGAFAQSTRFTAHLDETGIGLSLERRGSDEQSKSEDLHFHYVLFADILRDLAHSPDDIAYRDALRDSARTLYLALETNPNKVLKVKDVTRQGDAHAIRSSV